MDERLRTPLPWEEKAAIGCLAVLTIQEIHEFCVILVPPGHPRLWNLGPLAPLLVLSFLVIARGLLHRSPLAWWCGWTLLGVFGIGHLAMYWTAIRTGLGVDPAGALMRTTDAEYEWIKGPTLDPFGLFWVLARSVLLLASSALLLLGELRKKLASR